MGILLLHGSRNRVGRPGRLVTWRKCQVTESGRELAQTSWRATDALSTCTDRQREEEDVEMSLPGASAVKLSCDQS